MSAATIERCSPAWADYVWLARGERSRLYPVIRDFLQSIEAAAASVTRDLLDEFRRRRARNLMHVRLKCLLSSICFHRRKRDIYRGKIANELRAIRDAAVTLGVGRLQRGPLSQIMERCGSDKASGKHNYALFYEMLFRDDRARFARVFELGIGSNNVDVPSSMGPNGVPGASLRGWREYFGKAAIFGGDIDARVLFEEDRIRTGFVDQTRPESVERLFASFGEQFDLIVDDGCHQIDANRTFFEGAIKRLKDGGFYIIEDVRSRNRDSYKTFLSQYDAAILDIPHQPNHDDNCLAIVVNDREVDR